MRQRLVSGAVGQSSITVVIALLILVFSASGSEPSALVYAYDQGPAPIALARDIAQIDAADLLVRPFTNSPDRATATYDGLRDFARASARPAGYGSAPRTAGGLADAASGARLNARLAADEIASGHAYTKHVLQGGEFPGIRTRTQFADMVENVINNYGDIRHLSGGQTAYGAGTLQTLMRRAEVHWPRVVAQIPGLAG